MRVAIKRGAMLVAVGVAAALTLVACGNNSKDGTVVYAGEPQNPLIPGATNENLGGRVVNELFVGLVAYKPDSTPYNANAASITTDDAKVYKVTLKKNWKFHDGTPVKAKNYVDAWNYTANADHGYTNAPFLAQIAGYDDIHPAAVTGPDGKPQQPKAKTDKLTGLQVTGDYTFTVTLKQPFGEFTTMLGYRAFAPMPDSFYKDPKKFGQNPVGDGPYKFSSWDHENKIVLKRNDDYKGTDKGKSEKLTFKMYKKIDTAYNDVKSDNLAIAEQVPTQKLGVYKKDFPNRALNIKYGGIQTVTFPMYDKKFANADVRKAISMAVDRAAISKTVFQDTRAPADGMVAPVVPGYAKNQCGETCTYNADKAKQLLQKGGGFQGTLTISYNVDGGHQRWVDATCQSIQNTLGIKCEGKPYSDFGKMRTDIQQHKMDGLFSSGWQMDYPSIENFLTPIVRTDGSANDGVYSNADVDAALSKADATVDKNARFQLYQQAEKLALNDMPVIPLWNMSRQGVFSNDVKGATLTAFGLPDYNAIQPK